jgi:hypothetical protein
MKSFIQQDDCIVNSTEYNESKKKCKVGHHRFEYEPFDDRSNNINNNSHQKSLQLNRFQHLLKNLGINFKK